MSWRDLFKPQDKDPKNIVEWLGLITDDIKKLKNADNWYDEVNLLTDKSIIDNLETDVSEFALSARQGYLLNQKIGVSDKRIETLEGNVSQLQLDVVDINNKISEIKDTDIKLINDSIVSINETLVTHGQTLDTHGTDIEKNKSDLEGLNTRVTQNEEDIVSLDGRVTTNESNISSLDSRVTQNESDILDINSNIDIIEEDIADIRNVIDKNIEIGNTRIDSLVGTNVKISGLDVTTNSTNTQLTVAPGKAIIQGKIVEIKESIVKDIDPLLLAEDNLLYTLISLEEETENIVVSLSETDMDSKSLRIHSMIINNGSIIENSNNSNMIPISSIVGIAADNEAANIREQIPSGFTVLGELDYDYMRNNENQIKFKTKSVAYVNGYKVEIPAGTIVNIDKAPEKESRDDLLFLEAWKDIDFPKTGKLKWRIRYVNNVDFSRLHKGIVAQYNNYRYDNGIAYGITPQGGNDNPIPINNTSAIGRISTMYTGYYLNKDTISFPQWLNIKDMGLYYVGYGKGYEYVTKTIDGYVYAVNMFRLYRRPSCGKLEPYEFDKINKLCDYNKVKSLVTSEKVERVINETINGKTMLNHCTSMKSLTSSGVASMSTTITDNSFKITTSSAGSAVITTSELSTLLASTTYTILIDVDSSSTVIPNIGDRINSGAFGNNYIPVTSLVYGKNRIKFTTGTDLTNYNIWVGRTDSITSGSIISITNFMILEGDWTDSDYIPEYFSGLSSLGELEYNLIKVKNGIIHYPTYNPTTGNQKLETFEDVTHIVSENTIIPEFTAEVKKDGEKITDVSEYGKLETIGDEIVEFTKLKGRTLQNVLGLLTPDTGTSSVENGYWIVTGSSQQKSAIFTPSIVENGVKYTLFFTIEENTLVIDGNYRVGKININNYNNEGTGYFSIQVGEVGSKKIVFTSHSTATHSNPYVEIFKSCTSGTLKIGKFLLLKGDYSNISIEKTHYVEGIKSVSENDDNIINLKTVGKNKIPPLDDTRWWGRATNMVNVGPDFVELKGTPSIHSLNNLTVKPNTDYILSGYLSSEVSHRVQIQLPYNIQSNISTYVAKNSPFKLSFNSLDNDKITIWLRGEQNTLARFENIQLEEGSSIATEYEPYKEYRQEIYLKEPLRSLPNGVCDEIVGNKVIRRVGKVVLDGSETIILSGQTTKSNTQNFSIRKVYNGATKLENKGSLFSNFCNVDSSVPLDSEDYEAAKLHRDSSLFYININKARLSSVDVSGMKTWLSQNPTTVYYELANPVTEYLEHVYDKESIKTYQLDAPLRSLPNGVKDEIKDGVLIRRCGEIILDGSEGFTIQRDNETETTIRFSSPFVTNIKAPLCICDRFKYKTGATDEEEKIYITSTPRISITINKSRLTEVSNEGFKTWLSNNNTKVIYELLVPEVIKLNETHSTKTDYTINRQFKDGNWLRYIPGSRYNDTVRNTNQISRMISKITLVGTETWLMSNSTSTTTSFSMSLMDATPMTPVMCNMFNYSTSDDSGIEGIGLLPSKRLWIEISNSRFQSGISVSEFKNWLSKNNIMVYYITSLPSIETIDNTNYTYYPCHDKFNTICSSLYVTNGYNKIDVLNNIKSTNNIIETDYRVIENNSEVEDAHYKPSDNGKELSYKIPKGKNKINMFDYTLNESSNKCIVYRDDNKIVMSTTESSKPSYIIRYFVRLKPYTNYTISCDIESNEKISAYRLFVNSFASDVSITDSNSATNRLVYINSGTNNYATFKTDSVGSVIVIFCLSQNYLGDNSYAPNIPFSISNLQIEEGSSKTEYEEFIPDVRPFENVEINDVGDLRNLVSLTGYNYEQLLNKSFDLLLNGEI